MARLDWGNIQAPDFRAAMEGFRLASDQLNNAFGSARAGLSAFEADQADQANRRVALETAALTSEEQARAYAASLAARKGADNLSQPTLAAVAGKVNDILRTEGLRQGNSLVGAQITGANLGNEVARYNLTNAQDDRTHFVKDRAASEAARPWANRLLTAAQDPDPAKSRAAINQIYNDPEFKKILATLPPEQAIQLTNQPLNFIKSNIDIDRGTAEIADTRAGTNIKVATIPQIYAQTDNIKAQADNTRQQTASGAFALNVNQVSFADQQAAQAAATTAMFAPDVNSARNLLMGSGLKGQALQYGLQLLEPRFPGIVGSSPIFSPQAPQVTVRPR